MKISHLFKILVFTIVFLNVFTTINALSVLSYVENQDGVTFTMNQGIMKVQVCQSDIIRVIYTRDSGIPSKTSLSVNKSWGTSSFNQSESGGIVTIQTSRIKVKVNMSNASITYTDLNDNVILSEDSANSKIVTPVYIEGINTNKIETLFNSPSNEALYGLGQYQENIINWKGHNRHIYNTNEETNIPVLVSNRGYSILWDNYSTSDFYGGESDNTKYRYVSECGQMVDYYFMYGPSFDSLVALYRTTTGAAPLFPKWAFGLFQSKDRYVTQSEMSQVDDGYRNNNIPLDCVVQDWQYWSPYVWGSHMFDPSRYPDPQGLVDDMHDSNVHAMISIWPLYQYTYNPQAPGEMDNYNELNNIGALYPSTGDHHFYDTFSAQARNFVYQQIYDDLLGRYGWDAIWADNTEPQGYPDGVNVRAADTAIGKGVQYVNAYPLQHSKALYEGWRNVGPDQKRVYNLTRSGFTGQQRYATTCWSGDIQSTFTALKNQVPNGLNFCTAGMPYWTTDIGGYWGHTLDWSTSENNELFTRWFQYGAFNPIFRIHGGGSRELYGDQWNATTKVNLLKINNLRYRLMPYIYSLAWKVTSEGYNMMRHLIFDYQNDSNVYNIVDQFMFGPAFLVNPITSAGATSRTIYLPSGTWYNFWTGSTIDGGRNVSVSAPLSEIPLYIKEGSIVPMGPYIQYATQSIDPLEIRVYRGRNGSFTLYEDQGDTYSYENGQYSTIQFTWDETAQQLTIGERSGSYSGMPVTRTFNLVWVSGGQGAGVTLSSADQTVIYNGSSLSINPVITLRTRYEGENASLSGGAAVNTDHTGYSGTGFVDGYYDVSGASTAFTVNAETAGTYNVTLRYSAGNGTCTNMDLYVNNSKINDLTLDSTVNWDTWADATETLSLISGDNIIDYRSDSASTLNANIDYVDVSSNSTPEPTPEPTPTPTPDQDPIWSGGPYTLNGTTDYVDLPDGLTSDLNDFSIACWVNLNSLDNWSRIFDFGIDTNVFMMLSPASGTTGNPYFCITLTGNDGEQGLNGPSALPISSDQHFAITKSGSTAILYINGQEVDRNTNMTLNPADMGNTLNNYIGRSQWEQDPYLDGEVDEFFIYNRAISASEVADLANSSEITPEPTTTPATGTLGDANGDGTVDIVDALLIAQYYVNLDPANFVPENADVNCDGSIDIVDALLVAQYYVELIVEFCL